MILLTTNLSVAGKAWSNNGASGKWAGTVCCAKDNPEVAQALERVHKIFNQEGGEWNEGGMASIGACGAYLLVPPETGPTPCWTT